MSVCFFWGGKGGSSERGKGGSSERGMATQVLTFFAEE